MKKNKSQIVIENVSFEYNLGLALLKLKYKDCPFPEIENIWDVIPYYTFEQISLIQNLEQRRVAMKCFGLERLAKEVKPKLLNKSQLKKETTWVNEKGELVTHKFNDIYELYQVELKNTTTDWRGNQSERSEIVHYVKCKDTSTDRDYLLWVDLRDVYTTNDGLRYEYEPNKVDAIQAIAWTIQTNIPIGSIEKIVRQGDCILIKPKDDNVKHGLVRHLTAEEYKTLLVAES